MPEATLIEPDLGFKRLVLSTGGECLKKCAQCGTCSIVCPISPDVNPFPRKEIVWAQWGLRDRLMRDPDLWLCHQCNDCAVNCPRGANPGDVMAVLRQRAIEHYATPRFLARWVANPRRVWALFVIPAVLLLTVIWRTGGLSAIRSAEHVDFDKFFPHIPLDIFFLGFTALAGLATLAGLARFWYGLSADAGAKFQEIPALVRVIGLHEKFRQCETSRLPFLGQWCVFYGFIGMFATTTLAFLCLLFGNDAPYPLWHPVKILGNLSGAVFAIGWAFLFINRLSSRKEAPASLYVDWLFLCVIGGTVGTGFLAYGARVADLPAAAYPLYFIHLVLVFFLLVYFPYSKFIHLLYRATAMARK
ncbi:MAG: quinone-interacting membrane-bound oxidoreductase complex subunit QmoC [Candidatus Sumerlaeota bacterium]|nr:quinone-interacting membrane-bound oxidoreductase complex subunit QmoC [Candidatus Sumerlaeota bacterium]